MAGLKKRGIWCGPGGSDQNAVDDTMGRLKAAGFTLMLPNLKGGHGLVRWHSKRFPHLIEPEFADFDPSAALVEAKKKHGMEVHAWFIDYYEGQAYKDNPDWAQRDAHGRPTSEEMLRGERFSPNWMCPAQRPGYTDQRLVPLYEEFAQLYEFDAVHHDYIRYPGDLAPDQYCFCDHCLEEIPKWANLRWDKYPDERFDHDIYDREYLEAHWEPTPTALPPDWDQMQRHMKAHFLLEGRFFEAGRADLDHFFYEYRMHWITEFARESAEAVRAARPGMKISQAVFKNPIHAGRFIGQDWRRFAPYVDSCMPMNYRDHFPGTYEQYLVLLEEIILRQKNEWAINYEEFLPGMAFNFLFYEEEEPLQSLKKAVEKGDPKGAAAMLPQIRDRVAAHDTDLVDNLDRWIDGASASLDETLRSARWYKSHLNTAEIEDHKPADSALVDQLGGFLARPPVGYFPSSKVERLIDMVADTGVDGLVFFSDGQLGRYGLWDTVTQKFAQHS